MAIIIKEIHVKTTIERHTVRMIPDERWAVRFRQELLRCIRDGEADENKKRRNR